MKWKWRNGIMEINVSKFFCCCDECGSIEWVDLGFINALERDGDIIESEAHQDLTKRVFDYFCNQCEKPLKPIFFRNVRKEMRMRIYKMSEEERINWVTNYWIVNELKKDDKLTTNI